MDATVNIKLCALATCRSRVRPEGNFLDNYIMKWQITFRPPRNGVTAMAGPGCAVVDNVRWDR